MESNDNKKKTPARRQNRLAAVQFLYMWDVNPGGSVEESMGLFLKLHENREREYYKFAEELVVGTIGHMEEIDKEIMEHSANWSFDRIAKADLAILRVAIYELFYRKDVPPIVAINEAIDLAKALSTQDSRRFVNGILDKVKERINRPLRSCEE